MVELFDVESSPYLADGIEGFEIELFLSGSYVIFKASHVCLIV